jgi:hypothetical protein
MPILLTVTADDANARDTDLVVPAVLLVSMADISISQGNEPDRRRSARPIRTSRSARAVGEGLQASPQVFAGARAHGNGPIFLLPVTHDQQIRNLAPACVRGFYSRSSRYANPPDAEALLDKGFATPET